MAIQEACSLRDLCEAGRGCVPGGAERLCANGLCANCGNGLYVERAVCRTGCVRNGLCADWLCAGRCYCNICDVYKTDVTVTSAMYTKKIELS